MTNGPCQFTAAHIWSHITATSCFLCPDVNGRMRRRIGHWQVKPYTNISEPMGSDRQAVLPEVQHPSAQLGAEALGDKWDSENCSWGRRAACNHAAENSTQECW